MNDSALANTDDNALAKTGDASLSQRPRGRPPGAKNKPKARPRALGIPFWFGSTLIVAAIVVFGGVLKDPKTLAVAAPTLLVLTALTQVDRFRKIKGAGFEAELIAEAREVTKEAQATVEDLRKIALVLSRVSIEALTNQGRLGNDVDKHREYIEQVQKALRAIGCRKTDVESIADEAKEKWRADRAAQAINELSKALSKKHDDLTYKKPEVVEGMETLNAMYGDPPVAPDPRRLRDFAKQHGLASPEVEKALTNLERESDE